ncbi:Lytic transglycosylase OS=Rhodanobacter lindaniclasticus OX=75310 GN=B1991_09325 PE=3 SV=1 [Rhodanobacter lindaniclasticus]
MRFGLGVDNGFDTRFDPAASARANAEYLNEQLRIFNNNLELVIGAYNGGERRMRRAVGDDPSVSFYDPRIYNQMSPETRDYVPAVLAAAWLFLHPDSYNLRFPKVDGNPGSITLKRAASLDELTVCLGSADGMSGGWFRTLRNLNPRLDPDATQPVEHTAGAQPAGRRLRLALRRWPVADSRGGPAQRHGAGGPDPPPAKASAQRTTTYRVRHGDTLISIVRKLHCSSVQEISEINDQHHRIRVGQQPKVPVCR